MMYIKDANHVCDNLYYLPEYWCVQSHTISTNKWLNRRQENYWIFLFVIYFQLGFLFSNFYFSFSSGEISMVLKCIYGCYEVLTLLQTVGAITSIDSKWYLSIENQSRAIHLHPSVSPTYYLSIPPSLPSSFPLFSFSSIPPSHSPFIPPSSLPPSLLHSLIPGTHLPPSLTPLTI